ncbi:DoxX family protein [Glycomyces tenuis]|uniref:DoxX family protein n=1 Tax=Glycomyces tenuis TaxID=58116 RepID=UPI0004190AF7|nr:DoxX family protein [Glycomyces tenuis]
MPTRTTHDFPRATVERSTARSGPGRFRSIAFWAVTLVVAYELASGSVWNLVPITWVEVQLHHLGYPHYFAHILGAAQLGAAIAIVAPGLPILKEWAYVGCCFLWVGAVVSHLIVGDDVQTWSVPLGFGALAIASWALRPADRRVPRTGRGADEPGTGAWEIRPRAWVVPLVVLVVLYAVSILTLPIFDDMTYQWAVDYGWITE